MKHLFFVKIWVKSKKRSQIFWEKLCFFKNMRENRLGQIDKDNLGKSAKAIRENFTTDNLEK